MTMIMAERMRLSKGDRESTMIRNDHMLGIAYSSGRMTRGRGRGGKGVSQGVKERGFGPYCDWFRACSYKGP